MHEWIVRLLSMGLMQNIDRQTVISNPKTLFVYDDFKSSKEEEWVCK
jgi:hypothetical protein